LMKKKIVAIALSSVLLVSLSTNAFAHDGWSQTNSPIIAPGEVSYVDLLFGNHSNEHKSYRISGQWSKDTSKVYVTSPSGKKVDITSTLFYTGESATETEPAVNNGFVTTFSSSSLGAHIISVEEDSIFKSAAATSRTLRSAKSFVAVSDIPTIARVKALKGFSMQVSTDRAELIPLFNPTSITPTQQVSTQLLLKGKPIADTEVTLIRRSNSEAQVFKTDAEGKVTFITGPADYYLLRAKPTSSESKVGEYDKMSYEATMTFTVQNGTVSWPWTKADPVPYVYVDGKMVANDNVVIENGTTYVDSAFIKQYLDANYAGNGSVVLRSAALSAQASLEYLPAVGDTRAVVVIYTKK
jgi:uncharacterized GH25 family protein